MTNQNTITDQSKLIGGKKFKKRSNQSVFILVKQLHDPVYRKILKDLKTDTLQFKKNFKKTRQF